MEFLSPLTRDLTRTLAYSLDPPASTEMREPEAGGRAWERERSKRPARPPALTGTERGQVYTSLGEAATVRLLSNVGTAQGRGLS
jgi:hypothetical protein